MSVILPYLLPYASYHEASWSSQLQTCADCYQNALCVPNMKHTDTLRLVSPSFMSKGQTGARFSSRSTFRQLLNSRPVSHSVHGAFLFISLSLSEATLQKMFVVKH